MPRDRGIRRAHKYPPPSEFDEGFCRWLRLTRGVKIKFYVDKFDCHDTAAAVVSTPTPEGVVEGGGG